MQCFASIPSGSCGAATSIALSGGNMISGDRLDALDPVKLEILKKITPSYGEAAVPVDLFDADIPTTFALRVQRPFAEWSVVALFNPDLERDAVRCFPLRRLGLDASQSYLAFDFWKQRFVGKVDDELRVKVAPGSVTLLALHAATGRPQLLSTSRHVTQGGVEIEDVQWHAAARSLRGVSTGPAGSAHDVFVHVPGDHPWTWGGRHMLYRDGPGYSSKLVDSSVMRVHVRFENETRVPWQIDFSDLLE